jgi:hypothetical protein
MNLVKHIDQYEEECVYFGDPIKNNVMSDGFFIRIIYSTSTFILNGINLYITINDIILEKYYNKYKCFFNNNTLHHKKNLENIQKLEENLLKKINIPNKIKNYKIYDQLKSGNIKFFLENNNTEINNINYFLLKISGIWETETHYGLTYKFVKLKSSIGVK